MLEDIYNFLPLSEKPFTGGMPDADEAIVGMHKIWDPDDYPIWRMFIEDNWKRSREGS